MLIGMGRKGIGNPRWIRCLPRVRRWRFVLFYFKSTV